MRGFVRVEFQMRIKIAVIAMAFVKKPEAIYFSDLRIKGESLTLGESKCDYLLIHFYIITIYILLDSCVLDTSRFVLSMTKCGVNMAMFFIFLDCFGESAICLAMTGFLHFDSCCESQFAEFANAVKQP